MKFNILDAEPVYRRMLASPDTAAREAIYRAELVAPFQGLVDVFGGGDGLERFTQWRMPLALFEGERHAATGALIDQLAQHDAWGQFAQALADAQAAFAPHTDHIPLDTVQAALLVGDLGSSNPLDRGYTGFGGVPGYVMTVYGKADDYTLPRIKSTTVHEFNHNVRSVVAPVNFMQVTLAYYMIMEGLAEAFAAELYGEDVVGYYVTDLEPAQLDEAKRVIGGALDVSGFNAVRSYIFGDAQAGVPPFAGYAIGYRVVRQFLERTGKTAAEATFIPAQDIIAESGYFA